MFVLILETPLISPTRIASSKRVPRPFLAYQNPRRAQPRGVEAGVKPREAQAAETQRSLGLRLPGHGPPRMLGLRSPGGSGCNYGFLGCDVSVNRDH